eukprot:Rmarinus@m.16323
MSDLDWRFNRSAFVEQPYWRNGRLIHNYMANENRWLCQSVKTLIKYIVMAYDAALYSLYVFMGVAFLIFLDFEAECYESDGETSLDDLEFGVQFYGKPDGFDIFGRTSVDDSETYGEMVQFYCEDASFIFYGLRVLSYLSLGILLLGQTTRPLNLKYFRYLVWDCVVFSSIVGTLSDPGDESQRHAESAKETKAIRVLDIIRKNEVKWVKRGPRTTVLVLLLGSLLLAFWAITWTMTIFSWAGSEACYAPSFTFLSGPDAKEAIPSCSDSTENCTGFVCVVKQWQFGRVVFLLMILLSVAQSLTFYFFLLLLKFVNFVGPRLTKGSPAHAARAQRIETFLSASILRVVFENKPDEEAHFTKRLADLVEKAALRYGGEVLNNPSMYEMQTREEIGGHL